MGDVRELNPEACKNRGGGASFLPTCVGARGARDTILMFSFLKRVGEPYPHDIPVKGPTKQCNLFVMPTNSAAYMAAWWRKAM